ncbi:MAG TPA: GIY-YIG nuclease family protein [Pelagibacterium sp.]|uniref:GIY-YIG nuclease family protein n=1 Tax=Pelagibacterium sp. TaxID=1967288 RepID=UPI002C88FCDC|nr:GIY-YIG nuclease family protein [Pelagibacterium sp.]HWJ86705.1 GIY-YIG nuclease family protein [Pelagibacterium sp.]
MSIVYVLTNAAMPGLIKIGITSGPIETRMRQLDSSGVPMPFEAFYAAEVEDAARWEKALHEAFGDHRVRSAREFFRISPDKPTAILKMIDGLNVTPKTDVETEPGDKEALQKERRRKSNFSFSLADIPHGSVLESVFDDQIKCIVISDRKVLFREQEHSLSSSALIVAREQGFEWASIAGPAYWKYEERTLSEIRESLDLEEGD